MSTKTKLGPSVEFRAPKLIFMIVLKNYEHLPIALKMRELQKTIEPKTLSFA